MNLIKESYNKIADIWHENRNKTQINSCVVDFASKIKPNGKILDIGCGTGYPIAKYLSSLNFEVTGIDISEKMLEKAILLNLPNAKFILCDFFDYRTTEKYDGVIAFDSLFHFPKERQEEIYVKISGMMNKGAFLLFTHGKENNELKNQMYGEDFYYSALDTQIVHRLLLSNGFNIESSIENYSEKTSGKRDLLIVCRKKD